MHAYHHIRLGNSSTKVKNSFAEFLADPWLKSEDGIFRFRRYLQARFGSEKYFNLCAAGDFFQSEKQHNYAGGISRKYPEIKKMSLKTSWSCCSPVTGKRFSGCLYLYV